MSPKAVPRIGMHQVTITGLGELGLRQVWWPVTFTLLGGSIPWCGARFDNIAAITYRTISILQLSYTVKWGLCGRDTAPTLIPQNFDE